MTNVKHHNEQAEKHPKRGVKSKITDIFCFLMLYRYLLVADIYMQN